MPPIPRPTSGGSFSPAVVALLLVLHLAGCGDARFDVVLAGGRVVDPATGLDGIRWIGVSGGRVGAITEHAPGRGERLNVRGLVVVPGFVDLHALPADSAALARLALAGVTSALLLEPGAYPVDAWLAARAGRSPVHFGAAVSYPAVRAAPFALGAARDSADVHEPLDGTAMEAIVRGVRGALAQGALGVAVPLAELPGATPDEIQDLFAVAGFDGAPVFVRPRDGSPQALGEVLHAAGLLGTPLHVVDVPAWAAQGTAAALARVDSARAAGTNATAGIRLDGSPRGGARALRRGGALLTGDGGRGAFLHALVPLLADPAALAAALARVTRLPARRLESFAPAFRAKGRVQVGADADLVVLDPRTGAVRHVLVGGVLVVRDGALVPGAAPGVALRGRGPP